MSASRTVSLGLGPFSECTLILPVSLSLARFQTWLAAKGTVARREASLRLATPKSTFSSDCHIKRMVPLLSAKSSNSHSHSQSSSTSKGSPSKHITTSYPLSPFRLPKPIQATKRQNNSPPNYPKLQDAFDYHSRPLPRHCRRRSHSTTPCHRRQPKHQNDLCRRSLH
jgi:hypothetical protein